MENQLTRTPYLVLFIILIAVGVGTASAVITITLSGNVLITEDLTVEGYIKTFDNIIVGDSDPNSVDYNRIGVESPANSQIDNNEDLFVSDTLEVGNDIFLGNTELTRGIGFYEDGQSNGEFIRWTNSNDEFEISDDLKVDGKLGIGISQADSALHVVGGESDHTPNKQGIQLTGFDAAGNVGIEMTGNSKTPYIDFQNDIDNTDFDARIALRGNDTLSVEGADLEVNGKIRATGLEGIFNFTERLGAAACGFQSTAFTGLGNSSNRMCFLVSVGTFTDLDEFGSQCSVGIKNGLWQLNVTGGTDQCIQCEAQCLTWD